MIRTCSTEFPFPLTRKVSRSTIADAINFLKSEGVRVRLDPSTPVVSVNALFNVGRLQKIGVVEVIHEAHRRGMTPRPIETRAPRGIVKRQLDAKR